jgi:hypothetical protein
MDETVVVVGLVLRGGRDDGLTPEIAKPTFPDYRLVTKRHLI